MLNESGKYLLVPEIESTFIGILYLKLLPNLELLVFLWFLLVDWMKMWNQNEY